MNVKRPAPDSRRPASKQLYTTRDGGQGRSDIFAPPSCSRAESANEPSRLQQSSWTKENAPSTGFFSGLALGPWRAIIPYAAKGYGNHHTLSQNSENILGPVLSLFCDFSNRRRTLPRAPNEPSTREPKMAPNYRPAPERTKILREAIKKGGLAVLQLLLARIIHACGNETASGCI
jgi:hypothetical protein